MKHLPLRILIILAVTVGAIWVASTMPEYETLMELIRRFGYIGLFLIAIVSGFNLISPVPAIAFVPIVVSAGLGFWPAVIIVTIGMTIGDAIGIFLGLTGRGLLNEWIQLAFLQKIQAKIKQWETKPHVIAFFYAAFVPLPNELLVIPLSFLSKKWKGLLTATFLGNIVFNILVALGLLGIVHLV